MNRAHGALFIVRSAPMWQKDTVAEWSKAPGSGPGSKERGFKSHRCQLFLTFYFFSTRFVHIQTQCVKELWKPGATAREKTKARSVRNGLSTDAVARAGPLFYSSLLHTPSDATRGLRFSSG